MKYFTETLYDSIGQEFRIDKMYHEQKTGHQHLMIFHNAFLGRVMTLDGVVQTTEADEHIYHEMLAHVPILAHGSVSDVLIVGGGDGAMLREVLKHRDVIVTQVEIDMAVIEMSKVYLPNHSQGAFDDPRARIVISDGLDFVRNSEQRFDVIICDSTDPIGPGKVLFGEEFYAACNACLNPGGILVTQNGVPFFQMDELKNTYRRMGQHFSDCTFYTAAVPTYYGGNMAFAWGCDNPVLRKTSLQDLTDRYRQAGLVTQYYNPGIHKAAFALPQNILDILSSTA